MDKTILLLGQDGIGTENLSDLLARCELPDSEIKVHTSLKAAESIAVDPSTWLVMINAVDFNTISKFLADLNNRNSMLPVIVLHSCRRKDLEVLISLGACEVINPKIIDENLLTQSILSAVERKRVEADLKMRDAIMRAVNYAAEVFLLHMNWDSRLDSVLKRLGNATRADKVCMYRNSPAENEGVHAVLHAEWVSDNSHEVKKQKKEIKCAEDACINPSWEKRLAEGDTIAGNINEFPQREQKTLIEKKIKSIALIPIFSDQVLWGYMAFQFYVLEKTWSENEIGSLCTAARIFGAGISRVDAETRLTHLATHDFLTNLPNRMLLEDRFEQAVARAERSNKKFGVIAIDLDKFKQVNDTYGHPFGDKVLVEIAWRLSETIRTSDTCARVGGDEFTVLAEGINHKKDLARVMEKLAQALAEPLQINGNTLKVTASMGASLYPDHGYEMEPLMNAADIALYQVKGAYSGHRIYVPAKQISLIEQE